MWQIFSMPDRLMRILYNLGRLVRGFVILVGLYLFGEWIAKYLPIPVPGAVIGMVIMFLLLRLRVVPLHWVDNASVLLLTFMGMFYIPYGVGIVESGTLIEKWGLEILGLVLLTILSVFFVSGKLFQNLVHKKNIS